MRTLIAFLLSKALPCIKLEPTHYVRLDMVDLAFTAKSFHKAVANYDLANPHLFIPCIKILGSWVVVDVLPHPKDSQWGFDEDIPF
ncbi:MAG: hypothetical protein GY776_07075 [Alteromonas sp.]|nr:hypothetical protein [Alteromonas sp.]